MSQLAQTLAQELECLDRFLAVLDEEHALLKTGGIEGLEILATQKAELVAQLAEHGALRDSLLASGGYSRDRAGMDACVKALAASAPQLPGLWTTFRTHATRARQLTESNTLMIASKLQTTQRALEILLHAGATPLYSADGLTAAASGKRIIDSA